MSRVEGEEEEEEEEREYSYRGGAGKLAGESLHFLLSETPDTFCHPLRFLSRLSPSPPLLFFFFLFSLFYANHFLAEWLLLSMMER